MASIGAFLIDHGIKRPQIEVIHTLDRLILLLQGGEAEAVVVDPKARH